MKKAHRLLSIGVFGCITLLALMIFGKSVYEARQEKRQIAEEREYWNKAFEWKTAS